VDDSGASVGALGWTAFSWPAVSLSVTAAFSLMAGVSAECGSMSCARDVPFWGMHGSSTETKDLQNDGFSFLPATGDLAAFLSEGDDGFLVVEVFAWP
jgi:hypothetical protein